MELIIDHVLTRRPSLNLTNRGFKEFLDWQTHPHQEGDVAQLHGEQKLLCSRYPTPCLLYLFIQLFTCLLYHFLLEIGQHFSLSCVSHASKLNPKQGVGVGTPDS